MNRSILVPLTHLEMVLLFHSLILKCSGFGRSTAPLAGKTLGEVACMAEQLQSKRSDTQKRASRSLPMPVLGTEGLARTCQDLGMGEVMGQGSILQPIFHYENN